MTVGCQMRPLPNILLAGVLTAFAAASPIAAVSPSATIAGTVTLTAADGGTFPGEGARVSLACAADGTTRTEVSDQRGAFRFVNVPVDRCSIQAEVQGFVAPPVTVVTAADQIVWSDLHLGIAPLRVGVNVGGTVPSDELKSPRRSCRSDTGRRLERPAKACTR
jgi:carboxypeptidase family protein